MKNFCLLICYFVWVSGFVLAKPGFSRRWLDMSSRATFVLSALLFLASWALFAPAAWLRWDANAPGDGVTGYKIYSGPASRSYGTNWPTGNVTTSPIPRVPAFYAVTALDGEGNETAFSEEVFFVPRPDCASVALLLMAKRTAGEPWRVFARIPVAATNGAEFFQLRIDR